MNIKRQRPAVQKSRLENEVILAVVILYLLLSGALLAIHFAVPADSGTATSSTSPSHVVRVHQATPGDAAKPSQGAAAANKKQD